MNGTLLKPSNGLLLKKVLMNYLADKTSLLDLTIQCTLIGLPLISHLIPSPVLQSSCLNVKLKMVVMPSLPDKEILDLHLSNSNSKNKNLSENIQLKKLFLISLSNKEIVVTSLPIMVMMFSNITGKPSLSLTMLKLSLKLQSLWLKCKPVMVETPLVLE
jgi:hypothetical protein